MWDNINVKYFPLSIDHEWYLAFKAVAGIATSADEFNPFQIWQSAEAYNDDIPEARQLTATFKRHYKSTKVLSWNTLNISEVSCVICMIGNRFHKGMENRYMSKNYDNTNKHYAVAARGHSEMFLSPVDPTSMRIQRTKGHRARVFV